MIRCIIIEDEIHVANYLSYLLEQCSVTITIEATLTSVAESVLWLKQYQTDLIFMDIQLEDGSSFSIFDHTVIDTPVIFTTSYDSYAIEAFKRNGIAYLLKPIDKDELENALQKFTRWFIPHEIHTTLAALATPYQKRFLIKLPNTLHSINTEDISYFFVQNKQVFLVGNDGTTYPLEHTLEQLEKRLDQNNFFRIHRQFIVSRDSIKQMLNETRGRVRIITAPEHKEEMMVSIDRAADFKRWMDS